MKAAQETACPTRIGQRVEFQTDHGGFAEGYVIDYENGIVTVRDDEENVWSGHQARVFVVSGDDQDE